MRHYAHADASLVGEGNFTPCSCCTRRGVRTRTLERRGRRNPRVVHSWDRPDSEILDPNPNRAASSQATSSHTLAGRIYHTGLACNTLVVAMASWLFQIWDVRNMQSPASQQENGLKYMTRVGCLHE